VCAGGNYWGDNQALNFTGLPMFWWFANMMVVMATAMIFHRLRRHLFSRDWQTLAFVLLEPLILIGVHGSAGIPYYIAITSAHSVGLSTLGTAGSIVISLFYMLLFGKAVTVPAEAPVPAAAPELRPPAPTDAVAARPTADHALPRHACCHLDDRPRLRDRGAAGRDR
jgi:hypothetical protein